MIKKQQELLSLLDEIGIDYVNHQHPPVFTVEEADRHKDGIEGVHSKNLFLKDRKKNLILLVTLSDKPVRLKEAGKKIGAKDLSFAKPELLTETLGVIPGAVTPFAVVNDTEHLVRLILDRDIMENDLLNFHPIENNATTTIRNSDLIRFMEYCGHDFEIVRL